MLFLVTRSSAVVLNTILRGRNRDAIRFSEAELTPSPFHFFFVLSHFALTPMTTSGDQRRRI